MKKFIKKIRVSIASFFGNHNDDVLIFIGCGVIVFATYQLSKIAAEYLIGFIFVVTGFLIGLGQRGKS